MRGYVGFFATKSTLVMSFGTARQPNSELRKYTTTRNNGFGASASSHRSSSDLNLTPRKQSFASVWSRIQKSRYWSLSAGSHANTAFLTGGSSKTVANCHRSEGFTVSLVA